MFGNVNVSGGGSSNRYTQVVRKTAAEFTSENTVYGANIICIESDTNKIKIGDGSTKWTGLGYSTYGDAASTIGIHDVTGAVAVSDVSKVSLTWTDPDDLVLNGVTLAAWAGTKVVRKAGAAPTSVSDGTLVTTSTTRNAHASTALVDSGLTNGTHYYYRFFPYTADGTTVSGSVVDATPNLYQPTITLSANSVNLIASSSNTSKKTVTVSSNSTGAFSVVSSSTDTVLASVSGKTITLTYVSDGTATVTVMQKAAGNYSDGSVTISVNNRKGLRYGYRIAKKESDPKARVTYLYDAVGMTPASITLSTSGAAPNLGSWGNVWFVKNNKPVMLKSDGTVDYYLYKNNYAHKAAKDGAGKYTNVDADSGENSDVANNDYDGNAMAQIPLCWVNRYETSEYIVCIVSDVQYDENYKAYAHTGSDGTIHDYFYWGLFMSTGSTSKMRSISGQDIITLTNATQEITACKANNKDTSVVNGKGWYTHTWSQWTLLQTLCVLMGKSTDTQSVFGYGWANGNQSDPGVKSGALIDKGQFFGYSAGNYHMKVFHIEDLWGMYWDRIAGLISDHGTYYVKMTPEGSGYRITDVTGMTKITSCAPPNFTNGWINDISGTEYGMLPAATSGSSSTYYCDYAWSNNDRLSSLLVGGSAHYAAAYAGAFTFTVYTAPSEAWWHDGSGLSYIGS